MYLSPCPILLALKFTPATQQSLREYTFSSRQFSLKGVIIASAFHQSIDVVLSSPSKGSLATTVEEKIGAGSNRNKSATHFETPRILVQESSNLPFDMRLGQRSFNAATNGYDNDKMVKTTKGQNLDRRRPRTPFFLFVDGVETSMINIMVQISVGGGGGVMRAFAMLIMNF